MTTLEAPTEADLKVPAATGAVLIVVRLVAVFLLAAGMALAHRCHGDEDRELWERVGWQAQP